ncbi:MAG: putative Ig domain-containing protein [Planctomycetes bacterium]|nr:putative Ig domain-containing protein [Planctomycetota bacterium]
MKIYRRLSSIIDPVLSTVLVFLVMILTLSKEAYAAEPVANAGADQIQVKTQLLSFEAVLNGVESYDTDGNSLTYQWYGPFDPVTGPAPAVSVPEGRYTVSLLVDDGMTMSLPDTTTIEIIPCFSLMAMARDRRVILGWSPQGSNILYEIYRSVASDPGNFVKIGETTSEHSAYVDYGVTNDTTYLYIVKANLQGRNCYSSVVSGQPFAGHSAPAVNPVIYSSPILYGATGIIYNYDVNATGAQHYSLSVFPYGMTIDPATGLIAWIPDVAGTFDVTVEVK